MALVAAAAAAWWLYAPRSAPRGQPELIRLAGDLDPFRQAFDSAGDRVRILVMLSPT